MAGFRNEHGECSGIHGNPAKPKMKDVGILASTVMRVFYVILSKKEGNLVLHEGKGMKRQRIGIWFRILIDLKLKNT